MCADTLQWVNVRIAQCGLVLAVPEGSLLRRSQSLQTDLLGLQAASCFPPRDLIVFVCSTSPSLLARQA